MFCRYRNVGRQESIGKPGTFAEFGTIEIKGMLKLLMLARGIAMPSLYRALATPDLPIF